MHMRMFVVLDETVDDHHKHHEYDGERGNGDVHQLRAGDEQEQGTEGAPPHSLL